MEQHATPKTGRPSGFTRSTSQGGSVLVSTHSRPQWHKEMVTHPNLRSTTAASFELHLLVGDRWGCARKMGFVGTRPASVQKNPRDGSLVVMTYPQLRLNDLAIARRHPVQNHLRSEGSRPRHSDLHWRLVLGGVAVAPAETDGGNQSHKVRGDDVSQLDPDVVLRMAADAPDAIVVLDREGLIEYWNHGAERIFGHAALEVVGTSIEVIVPERLRQRHHDGFMAAMSRGSTKYGEDDLLAVPALTADGKTVSIEFSIVLVLGPEGVVRHVGAVIRDVTERRAREQELRRRLENLPPQ